MKLARMPWYQCWQPCHDAAWPKWLSVNNCLSNFNMWHMSLFSGWYLYCWKIVSTLWHCHQCCQHSVIVSIACNKSIHELITTYPLLKCKLCRQSTWTALYHYWCHCHCQHHSSILLQCCSHSRKITPLVAFTYVIYYLLSVWSVYLYICTRTHIYIYGM